MVAAVEQLHLSAGLGVQMGGLYPVLAGGVPSFEGVSGAGGVAAPVLSAAGSSGAAQLGLPSVHPPPRRAQVSPPFCWRGESALHPTALPPQGW